MGGISYSRLRELMLDKIAKLGFDPALFGMHSLWTGGATAAANAGVQDRLVKRHGCWKSEASKDGHVKDSVQRWLEVSKSLGILWRVDEHTIIFLHTKKNTQPNNAHPRIYTCAS